MENLAITSSPAWKSKLICSCKYWWAVTPPALLPKWRTILRQLSALHLNFLVDSSAAGSGFQYRGVSPGGGIQQAPYLSLPPHWPYNCGIDLLPGEPLSSSYLYKLSKPKLEAMELCIMESLATGIIRPSSSPLSAGFFFVMKDRPLQLCID